MSDQLKRIDQALINVHILKIQAKPLQTRLEVVRLKLGIVYKNDKNEHSHLLRPSRWNYVHR